MSIKQCKGHAKQTGFTLVELAIVLVIIGLILGMAFKGKDLIDGAKVKSIAAQYNKIQAAFNIYFEKYGAYPGDGCTALQVLGTFVQCPTAGRNGILNTVNEANSALIQLQNANILTAADLQTPFGTTWAVSISTSAVFPPAGTNYLSFTNPVNAVPIATVADARYVCALDRMIDNGDSGAVAVGGAGTVVRSTTAPLYTNATDCWARTGTSNVGLRLLP